jgi:hypothetical protein
MEGAAGALLQRAIELDAALDAGFTITLDDIQAETWAALMVLKTERNKFERDRSIRDESQAPKRELPSGIRQTLPNHR